MRHNRVTKKLGRNHSERRALVENMVTSLLKHQQIRTTLPKAKVAQALADRIISLGKNDTLASRRQVFSYLQDHGLTSRIFKVVAPRFKSRQGGYTRILRLDWRKGDGAQMAILELTEKEIIEKKTKAKVKAAEHKHEHKEHAHEETPKPTDKEKPFAKPQSTNKDKPPSKTGFFSNLKKFFRNKGGS